jgi:predicted DNA-binding ribbon-helix-helix protein
LRIVSTISSNLFGAGRLKNQWPRPHRAAMKGGSSLVKHSVRIAGHATSVSLERAFWEALGEIAARRGLPISALLTTIDAERTGNLASAIRVFVLTFCRNGELGDERRCSA